MPEAGVAHNLVIVKIKKSYPGQGRKAIGSFYGAGQLMLTKYILVVSGDVDIRSYNDLAVHVLKNAHFRYDLIFTTGPLDVLDHSSDTFAFGGKLGIDATEKFDEELSGRSVSLTTSSGNINRRIKETILNDIGKISIVNDLPVVIAGLYHSDDPMSYEKAKEYFKKEEIKNHFRLVLVVDLTVDIDDHFMAAWQILGNSDPLRDIELIADNTLFIDGTIKLYHSRDFPRRWPNIVCSDGDTIKKIDSKWESLDIGAVIPSPSVRNPTMLREGNGEVLITKS